ncbi:MAG: metal-sensitive transcriptional regulator [Candidatus Omnitrophica bacterium]|nr:metal-sensitive transcriptional regulator [Candidatus Omnitrophota bacterium]
MGTYPDHTANLVALKRIEGQVRGIQKMIEEGKYCVDILVQIRAVVAALARVEDAILERHFEGCVTSAMEGASKSDKQEKLEEIMMLIKKFRKI